MTPMPKVVAEAVNKVMADVKHVDKLGQNEFHRYKFAKVEDLLAQVQPAMVKAGLIVVQTEAKSELVADGQAWAITYSFGLQHASGEAWDGEVMQTGMATARNSKGGLDDKAMNKCHTAARKYFLLALLQVPTGDIPDSDSEEDRPEGKRLDRSEQAAFVTAAIAAIDNLQDEAACAKWYGDNVAALKQAAQDERNQVMGYLKKRKTSLAPKVDDPAHTDGFGDEAA